MNLLTIFVFVLIIVLIYTVYKLMSKTTTTVSGFSDASKTLSVPCAKFGASTTSTYGYSTWIYIDAWQNTATDTTTFKKNILSRCKGSDPVFRLYLDNAQNNLNLMINGTDKPCTIRNIKLQKWVNITVSVYGNTVDMYLDGKLVRTCVLTAVPTQLAESDILNIGGGYKTATTAPLWTVIPDGDLRGYISNVVYKSDYFTPEEAWNIYSAGYSGAGMFDFVNRYKLNFSIVKGDQTVGQVSI